MTMPAQKPGSSKQDYGTPTDFLNAVRGLLNIELFWWDLAASEENTVTDEHHMFNEIDNSLVCDWGNILPPTGQWLWLNPPFSDIEPWVRKCWSESVSVACLVPASVGANWWSNWVHGKAQVYLLSPRMTFVGCEDPYPKDLALLLYRPNVIGGYSTWRWK